MALTPDEREVLETWTAWVRDHPETTMVGLSSEENELVEAFSLIGPENMTTPSPEAMASLRERVARLPRPPPPDRGRRGAPQGIPSPTMEASSLIGARVIH